MTKEEFLRWLTVCIWDRNIRFTETGLAIFDDKGVCLVCLDYSPEEIEVIDKAKKNNPSHK